MQSFQRIAAPKLALIAASFLASCGASGPTYEQPPNLCEEAGTRCVSAPVRDLLAVDGDTFELRRLNASGGEERVRIRLIGWDSPEAGDAAQCAAEATLGAEVEARAAALFKAGKRVSFLPDGTDRYGRVRAHVYLDGEHIGWRLSQEGLARPVAEGQQVSWCGA